MAAEPITLNMPKHIYERAQKVADTTAQSLEAVILHELETAFLPPLPPDEEAELNALTYLSDDAVQRVRATCRSGAAFDVTQGQSCCPAN